MHFKRESLAVKNIQAGPSMKLGRNLNKRSMQDMYQICILTAACSRTYTRRGIQYTINFNNTTD